MQSRKSSRSPDRLNSISNVVWDGTALLALTQGPYMRVLIGGLLLSLSLAPTGASADIYCGGDAPVLRVLTYRDGSVLVLTGWRSDFLQICNLNSSWKQVAPGTCFAWMSKIAGAISAGKRTGFWYTGLSPESCAAIPTYGNAPSPVYVDVAQ